MPLVGIREMLGGATREGYAVPAFSGFNAESAQAVVETALEKKSPALFICSPSEYALLGAGTTVAVVRAVCDAAGVSACLHLDHAGNIGQVREAIDAGFTSVMLDCSKLPFDENVGLTREAAQYAHSRGVAIEAELGAMGRADDVTPEGAAGTGSVHTDPGQAARFVELTGCDLLAVSIGNAHGLYRRAPSLDFDRLGRIRDAVGVPLVLHGGSGTPEDQIRRAVSLGIAKVNVASELARAYNEVYMREITEGKTWWVAAKRRAKDATRVVIGRWMDILGSGGRA